MSPTHFLLGACKHELLGTITALVTLQVCSRAIRKLLGVDYRSEPVSKGAFGQSIVSSSAASTTMDIITSMQAMGSGALRLIPA